jgi:ABC-type transport system substrate-binding protein
VFSKEDLATGPVKDVRVRHAISMALNRDEILDSAFGFKELKALGINPSYDWTTFIPQSHLGYWLDPKKDMSPANAAYFKYNPAESKKLLEAAGFKDGLTMEWHYNSTYSPAYHTTNELVPQFLKAVGINFKTVIDDYSSVFIPQTFKGNFSGAAAIYYTLGETGNFIEAQFSPGLPRNTSGIDDPKINALVASYQNATSTEERQKLVRDMQEVATETMYYVPLPNSSTYSGLQPNARNAVDYRSQGHQSTIQDTPWYWKA